MSDGTFPVQWAGQQAVITLPEHIDHSNADQIREQLLWIINGGAAVLIADLTGTISCDYSGANALARTQHRALANRTELRLVVTGGVVRRVLSLSGFDRLVAVYPDLDGAIAAGAERRELAGEQATPATGRAEELLGVTVDCIFDVRSILQTAIVLPPDVTAQRITQALSRLDDAAREIRNYAPAERRQSDEPNPARRSPAHTLERLAQATNRSKFPRRHVAQAARAVQPTEVDTAALLERQADLLGRPGRIDYPTEVKQWRDDQAEQMADRWQQP